MRTNSRALTHAKLAGTEFRLARRASVRAYKRLLANRGTRPEAEAEQTDGLPSVCSAYGAVLGSASGQRSCNKPLVCSQALTGTPFNPFLLLFGFTKLKKPRLAPLGEPSYLLVLSKAEQEAEQRPAGLPSYARANLRLTKPPAERSAVDPTANKTFGVVRA